MVLLSTVYLSDLLAENSEVSGSRRSSICLLEKVLESIDKSSQPRIQALEPLDGVNPFNRHIGSFLVVEPNLVLGTQQRIENEVDLSRPINTSY